MLCLNIIKIAIAFSTSRQFKIKQIFSNIQKKAAQFQAVLKCVFISFNLCCCFSFKLHNCNYNCYSFTEKYL